MKKFILCCLFVAFWVCTLDARPSEVARPIRMEVSTKVLGLGDVVRLDVFTTKPIIKQDVTFIGKSFTLFMMPKKPRTRYHYVSFIAASRKLKSGLHFLKTDLTLSSNFKFKKDTRITLNVPKRPTGKVNLSEKKNGLSTNSKQLAKEINILNKGFYLKTPKLYIKSAFKMPAKGRLSSKFGSLRKYNGSYSRSHAGVDIANKVGSPVIAPNNGKVVVSQDLDVHGRTIMIDHGFGLVTVYNHLSERFSKEGQWVNKGDLIGRIGSTGVATGPHLHWGMSVQNVRVDALKWIN